MANQQYPYVQPGPSYYQPPPPHLPPHAHYGYPNPAAPPFNPYQYPMSPVDGLHPPASPVAYTPTSPRMHSPAPPRGGHAPSPRVNGGRGGYPPRGGGPGYQVYHHMPMPHQQQYMPQHQLPPPQHNPYAPRHHPQKYPIPPAAQYPAPHYQLHAEAAPYSPTWNAQPQPLSPLPKQMSMLSSLNPSPQMQVPQLQPPLSQPQPRRQTEMPSFEPEHMASAEAYAQIHPAQPPFEEPLTAQTPSPHVTLSAPLEHPVPENGILLQSDTTTVPDVENTLYDSASSAPTSSSEVEAVSDVVSYLSSPAPVPASPLAQSIAAAARAAPTFTSLSVSSDPSAGSPAIPAGAALPSSSESDTSDHGGGWVIWSKRPTNPTLAPGIIFSTRARVRTDLVKEAIGEAIDDKTPPRSPSHQLTLASLPDATAQRNWGPGAQKDADAGVETATESGLTEASVEAQPPSSSATETEVSSDPGTPTPGSPLTSNTSLSISPAAPGKVDIVPTPSAAEQAVQPLTPTAAASELEGESAPSTSASAPAQIATPPKPLTKSWASLLRPAGAGSSKSALPTSSVVGFSIPGGTPLSGGSDSLSASSLPIPASARSEVVNLLTKDPGGFAGWAPKIRPRGLVNSGNMCFANAVLQVLVYCPPFYKLFHELGHHLVGPVVGKDKEKQTPLLDATIQFLREFEVKEPAKKEVTGKGKERQEVDDDEEWGVDSFMPTYVYDAMKEKKRFEHMRGGHQEDAEEFLGFYLDTLEEELLTILHGLTPAAAVASSTPSNAADAREDAQQPHVDGWVEVGKKNRTVVTRTLNTVESPITRVFGGKFRSTLRAPHQKDSVMVEDWRALQLDIQPDIVHTIKDALSQLSQPQNVQINLPTRPGHTTEASQHVLIDTLPPILILHLKRFLYDTNVKDVVKISKKVSFDRELEIGPDVMAPARRIGKPARYKLFGVLYHHGLSASGGHYTLDVLHPNRDLSARPREAWIRIDDELVSDVRPEDVFGVSERDDRCAYLLFYRRIGGGAPART